jgi:hypothetical protein
VKISVSQLASERLGEPLVEERIVANVPDKMVEVLIQETNVPTMLND